jgi:hypothetical protein
MYSRIMGRIRMGPGTTWCATRCATRWGTCPGARDFGAARRVASRSPRRGWQRHPDVRWSESRAILPYGSNHSTRGRGHGGPSAVMARCSARGLPAFMSRRRLCEGGSRATDGRGGGGSSRAPAAASCGSREPVRPVRLPTLPRKQRAFSLRLASAGSRLPGGPGCH